MVHPTDPTDSTELKFITHRIHGAAMYGNMDPVNIPPMLAYVGIYTSTMDPIWVIFFKGLVYRPIMVYRHHGLKKKSGDLDHGSDRSDRSEVGGQVWAVPPREE